jgi:putative ABC transport system substrate-binding protein
LLQLSPDVILAASTPNLIALLRQGPLMPIVFALVSDPVAQGFVSNLARPGGNITGFSSYEVSIGSKWIDLLKQVAPNLARVAVVFNPDTSPQSRLFIGSIDIAARSLGVEANAVPVSDVMDIERAIENMSRQPGGGLVFPTDSFLVAHRRPIIDLVLHDPMPAIEGSFCGPKCASSGVGRDGG